MLRAGCPAGLLALCAFASGCTYFELPDRGDWVIGRTMELGNFAGVNDRWQVALHPRGEEYKVNTHHLVHHQQPTKYGYVAVEAETSPRLGLPPVQLEGMNERGLSVSALSLRNSVYEDADPSKTRLNNLLLVPWMLGNFEKTSDVEAALENVTVVLADLPASLIGLHWAITDADGASVVVEYVKGQRRVHRNDVRVLTNDPPYDWHVLNLNSYVFLSPSWVNDQNKDITVSTAEFGSVPTAPGHGYNLGGLPGDMSPASRFVRTFYLKQYALTNARPRSTEDLQVLATGLLNDVYLNVGTIARHGALDAWESTSYAIVKMPKSGKFLVRSQKNMQWRLVDLRELDFTVAASFFVENGFSAGVRDDTGLLKRKAASLSLAV